jgi:GT2 family glycosyltransferase
MVSIVIPVFNAVSYTENCIEQIYKVYTNVPFEVIVVDNCSSDETEQLLEKEQKRHHNFRSFRMPNNAGFGGAVNHGCRQAEGNIIVILNNDTLVTSGWLERLTAPFHKDESIGIVSPSTNYVGEGPQIDPDAVNISADAIEAYAEKIKDRDYIHESNRLVFFCVAIKRELFDIVGDLDIGYEKGNYEDDDYCMRTIIAGFRLAIARSAFVYHFGTMTFKKNKISHNEYMEKNRKRFFQKAQNIAVTLRPPTLRMSEITASVIVRTLNRPELLQKALKSLSNQTFKDFEVVLVNDGGETISDLLGAFENYYPINYVHNDRSQGRTAALNIGIKHSRGKWIAFLDDDDIVYPWHLDALTASAKTQQMDKSVFYSNYNRSLFLSKRSSYPQITQGVEPWEYDPQKLLIHNYIPIHSWLIARKCFDETGYFNEKQEMLEDYEFLIRLSKKFSFYHVKRFTCEYRFYMDGINSMTTQRSKTLEALQFIYNQHPVTDPRSVQARKLELASLANQIETIKKLQSSLEEGPSNDAYVNRKIIHLITGI